MNRQLNISLPGGEAVSDARTSGQKAKTSSKREKPFRAKGAAHKPGKSKTTPAKKRKTKQNKSNAVKPASRKAERKKFSVRNATRSGVTGE